MVPLSSTDTNFLLHLICIWLPGNSLIHNTNENVILWNSCRYFLHCSAFSNDLNWDFVGCPKFWSWTGRTCHMLDPWPIRASNVLNASDQCCFWKFPFGIWYTFSICFSVCTFIRLCPECPTYLYPCIIGSFNLAFGVCVPSDNIVGDLCVLSLTWLSVLCVKCSQPVSLAPIDWKYPLRSGSSLPCFSSGFLWEQVFGIWEYFFGTWYLICGPRFYPVMRFCHHTLLCLCWLSFSPRYSLRHLWPIFFLHTCQ